MTFVTTLTDLERRFATELAEERNRRSTEAENAPAFGAPSNEDAAKSLSAHVTGAMGEWATAKLLGIYPNLSVYHEEKRTSEGFDLPHRIGVRTAQKRFGLLVRPSDPANGRFVAAYIEDNSVRLLGWELVERARQEDWLSAPHGRPPCYLKPERLLQPLSTLGYIVALERVSTALGLGEKEQG